MFKIVLADTVWKITCTMKAFNMRCKRLVEDNKHVLMFGLSWRTKHIQGLFLTFCQVHGLRRQPNSENQRW